MVSLILMTPVAGRADEGMTVVAGDLHSPGTPGGVQSHGIGQVERIFDQLIDVNIVWRFGLNLLRLGPRTGAVKTDADDAVAVHLFQVGAAVFVVDLYNLVGSVVISVILIIITIDILIIETAIVSTSALLLVVVLGVDGTNDRRLGNGIGGGRLVLEDVLLGLPVEIGRDLPNGRLGGVDCHCEPVFVDVSDVSAKRWSRRFERCRHNRGLGNLPPTRRVALLALLGRGFDNNLRLGHCRPGDTDAALAADIAPARIVGNGLIDHILEHIVGKRGAEP
mmetsp:Transcript_30030/g.66056  ORF Transcript_30030/g.66056 Transcript_30030/m.66056 type:complete len:279 (-) Transcript_30030:771-1607(-)